MCGIVGGVSSEDITNILISGLKALEYRGYDSAGIAISHNNKIKRKRSVGKVANLEAILDAETRGNIGIAHTRWATHGKPSKKNAHPHICNQKIAVVHNGIIENFAELKAKQDKYHFTSNTDTETVTHEIFGYYEDDLLTASTRAINNVKGAYGLGIIASDNNHLIAAKHGSPLVIGLSDKGNFIASDALALIGVTSNFIYLEDGDIADITLDKVTIYNNGKEVKREIIKSNLSQNNISLGGFKHYMHKEIFEQPKSISNTLEGRITDNEVLIDAFGFNAREIFADVKKVQIIACGTSFNAGLVAKYWLEEIAKVQTNIEVASEYRYRKPLILDKTLFVFISQSGETADTLEAMKMVKKLSPNSKSLVVCNSAESSMIRIADLKFLTHAGPEIGVASTKAFTTQLVALALFTVSIAKVFGNVSQKREKNIVNGLLRLPNLINQALKQEDLIKELAQDLGDKFNALFLGRGTMHAIAMEGALKLKEISYIHAEAYPAGELKHGPIALIDAKTPVIAVAPNDDLLDKLKSNLAEVKSRGSEMIVFEDETSQVEAVEGMKIIPITKNLGRITAPIIFTIPLQLLSYHAALLKGTDVDKPRNLAKSVTVE
jgi:glucosamine--fructose-6-phosphate aminotransferase (isomerizing)